MAEKDSVKEYYGRILTSTEDLKATAVVQCSRKTEKLPKFITDALGLVHEDISSRAYGCATAYPEALEGVNILDLGSGCGRDCFVLSNLVGANGQVVGLDMTDELLKLATDKIAYHTEKYGYPTANVKFVKGYMEKMGDAGLKDDFFDVIVSNCVISLCRDKRAVLREAFRVLKTGGELYFSDMYRDGDLPLAVLDDDKMWCEGLIGSLTYRELHDIALELGFSVPRMVRADAMPVLDEDIKHRLGNVQYASVTYRLFKKPTCPKLHVQSKIVYQGNIRGSEDSLRFDVCYTFAKGEMKTVDSHLVEILSSSRFSKYFQIYQPDQDTELPSLDIDPFKYIKKTSPNKSCSAVKTCSNQVLP